MKKALVSAIIVAALAIGIVSPAGAAQSKTPRSCKVALRDSQKAVTLGAHIISTLSEVIQLMPDALRAAAAGDGSTLDTMSATIAEKTSSVKDDTAKIRSLTAEFQSNRDRCLAG